MRTAVLAGCRTPFARAGTRFAEMNAADLAQHAVRERLRRNSEIRRINHPVPPARRSPSARHTP